MVDDKNQNLTKIWVAIPTKYLEKFDYIINGFYLSRSEAIRHGMSYVLKDIRGYKRLVNSRNGNSWEDS
jgi:metal-responsive CopG/Arc/MetJ family transcriptional regulator